MALTKDLKGERAYLGHSSKLQSRTAGKNLLQTPTIKTKSNGLMYSDSAQLVF